MKNKKDKIKKISWIDYTLIIIGTLLTYYGYLSKNCGCFYKVTVPISIGWILIIIGLIRLK